MNFHTLLGLHMARTSKYSLTPALSAATPYNWHAGLYIRLSREDGDKPESESVSSQKALLDRFVEENGEIFLQECYVDDGYSGTDFERPAFQKMMADAANKTINCIIVKDLSRLGRNYVEAGRYIEYVFPAFGIRFISVNDRIDSFDSPSSVNNVIVPFKNIMNDEYCRDISLKVRSALDVRRRQGRFIGSFAAYGYKKDENDRSKLVIDEDAADTVRKIFKDFLNGYSIKGIASLLNERGVPNPSAYKKEKGLNCNRGKNFENSSLWSDSTVRRILSNEVYIGNLVQKKNEIISYKIHTARAVEEKNRIRAEGTHEPIISKVDFDTAQSLLKRDTRTSPSGSRLSVFAGFIKCADCGRAMVKRTVRQPNKTYDYYACSTYRRMHSKSCTKHAIRADALEKAVLSALNKYISLAVDFDRLIKKINRERKGGGESERLNAALSAKKRQLEITNNLLLDLYPDYKSGILSKAQYLALKERYEKNAECARKEIENTEKQIAALESGVDGGNEFISTFKKYGGINVLTRDVMVELIENIYVREDGSIDIKLKCCDAFALANEYFENRGRGASELKRNL